MCTVTYIYQGNNNFILTSNRDEHVQRPEALPPKVYDAAQNLIYPKDPQGKGTWIACSDKFTVCLLNGAFQPHVSKPPYRKSRGLIVLDVFNHNDVQIFAEKSDLTGIEPFTLILIENQTDEFIELRWDGTNKHISPLSKKKNRIWSSATLYDTVQQYVRKRFFDNFFKEHPPSPQNILKFHQTKEINGGEGIFIQRKNIQTVSITQVEVQNNRPVFKYYPSLTTSIESL
ncbi:MAG: hypothetical protein D6707_01750 [Bacteroidetes bacterium]|nr:MAG: hypothetical protein D6707_01750 [Bacteroidota bacterium]